MAGQLGKKFRMGWIMLLDVGPWPMLRRALRRASRPVEPSGSDDVLYAYYDLNVMPRSYDMNAFILAAEIARRKAGCQSIDLIIVPGDAFERARERAFYLARGHDKWDPSESEWRISHIVVPAARLLRSVRRVVVAKDRDVDVPNGPIFPELYHPTRRVRNDYLRDVVESATSGEGLKVLSPSPVALNAFEAWRHRCGIGDYVTITLRRSPTSPERNSNVDAWLAFAKKVLEAGFAVIVLDEFGAPPDASFDAVDGIWLWAPGQWDLDARAACYAGATSNWGVNNGPLFIAPFLEGAAETIILKALVNGVRETSPRFLAKMGLSFGGALDASHPLAGFLPLVDSTKNLLRAWDVWQRGGIASVAANMGPWSQETAPTINRK